MNPHFACCCGGISACCVAGLALAEANRGYFQSTGQVCAFDGSSPVSLDVNLSSSYSLTVTTPFDPCSPSSSVITVSDGTLTLDSDDTNPGGGPVFDSFCDEAGNHFIRFTTAINYPDNPETTQTNDDACGAPSVTTSRNSFVEVMLRPFWSATTGVWLDVNIGNFIEFGLTRTGTFTGPRRLWFQTSGITTSASITASDPCTLVVTVTMSYSASGPCLGTSSCVETVSASLTLTFTGLHRCNPDGEGFAALRSFQSDDPAEMRLREVFA